MSETLKDILLFMWLIYFTGACIYAFFAETTLENFFIGVFVWAIGTTLSVGMRYS